MGATYDSPMTDGDLSAQLQFEGPLHLGRTVRLTYMWGASTWVRLAPDGAWVARRWPEGPGTLRVRQRSDHLQLDAWGPGARSSLDQAADWVGLPDRDAEAMVARHPSVRTLLHQMRGARLGRTREITGRLIAVALAQKVTGKNSKAALRNLAWKWGDSAPGPRTDLRLLPDWDRLAGTPYHRFHPLGIERRRADLVRLIASRANALNRALDLDPAAARRHLRALPGIGPWTAAIVIGSALGDPDSVPVGDVHLPNWVAWHLAGEERGTDERMLELLEPYAGQRGRVVRMIKSSGRGPPRYGPKATVRDIRST